jgi:VIT1/CCC1 family predicted Fe2+/Mn2+ transporter
MSHHEVHRVHRVGWLRAAVLGANDGIVSTASLIIGVAAASTTHENILLAGVAGLVAGAMSMAAGDGECRSRARATVIGGRFRR